ncbi:MAG: VWA domain-containing protein [Halieaceae bacterium]
MRIATWLALACILQPCASFSEELSEPELNGISRQATGELKVEILSPAPGQFLEGDNRSVIVDGGASSFGGVRYLDLVFVLDNSKSLRHTDPENFLSAGAVGLIESLSPKSDIQVGVVSFDFKAGLLQPLTANRGDAVKALRKLDRDGGTNIADGIQTALTELDASARPDSSRVIMLFTDGLSNARKARLAMEEAKARGVAVHTLLLGSDEKGVKMLQEIAGGTGGSFVQVTDPAMLPEVFLNLRTTGVDSVALQVNEGEPVPAQLAGGSFSAEVTLQPGENRITAIAQGIHGATATTEVRVTSGPPNCASLELIALRDGLPTASINDRAVEIVVDASRSMWGRMQGEPKMVVAKQTLRAVSDDFSGPSNLALRAYGNSSESQQKDCSDSELLVAFGRDNREQINQAIEELRPLGQTPLAYALSQAARDFDGIEGEKVVVLVTDGIESCGGDPELEASTLRDSGIAIHVIGFGLDNAADEDTASLDAIAQAAGGRFFLAGSSEELQRALADSVGTSFRIYDGLRVVASSVLGSAEPILLPKGQYLVELDSTPPREMAVTLIPGEKLTLTLEKQQQQVSDRQERQAVGYTPCPTSGPAQYSMGNDFAGEMNTIPTRGNERPRSIATLER